MQNIEYRYPKIVLTNAQIKLTERREEYERLSKQKKDKLYKEIPQLKVVNTAISETLKTAIGSGLNKDEIKEAVANLTNMRNRIFSDKKLHADCFQDEYFCATCQDEGFLGGEICSCYSELIKKEAYQISNLSERIETENFEAFNINIFNNKKEIEFILKTVMRFCNNDSSLKNNLIFIGTTGTGKTFMSSCVAKYLLDNKAPVLYLSATKISNIINDAQFKKVDAEMQSDYLNFAIDCDLLIIDDLGTEFQLPYPQSQLFDILETRHIKGKKTVISTNLQPDALTQKYSARFTSRLLGNYEILVFNGLDLRNKTMY